MSSSSEEESFTIGAHVDATDGRCGVLTRVIFDPVADSLTHLIVEPGHHEEQSRLVPVDRVVSAEDNRVRLNCTKAQFDLLDDAEEAQFIPADRAAGGYGDHALAFPYYGVGGLGLPLGHHHAAMFVDRVPVGEVEIRRGDPVHARDGLIGAVQGLVVDPADHHVTHLLLQEGHLWGRKEVAIPIGAAKRASGQIRVDLTKEQIEALPPVGLGSRG
jgi:uncharacterized protein YrrD